MRRSIVEVAVEAVRERSAVKAAAVADKLRAMGLNYDASFKLVRGWCADAGVCVSVGDWDELLYDADEGDF